MQTHRFDTGLKNRYISLSFAGYSMYPALRPGDILITQKIPAERLCPGDIISYQRKGKCLVHRVIGTKKGTEKRDKCSPEICIQTKGDNMLHRDPEQISARTEYLKVILIRRKKKLIRPGFGPCLAFLSRHNLTPGIMISRINRYIKKIYIR